MNDRFHQPFPIFWAFRVCSLIKEENNEAAHVEKRGCTGLPFEFPSYNSRFHWCFSFENEWRLHHKLFQFSERFAFVRKSRWKKMWVGICGKAWLAAGIHSNFPGLHFRFSLVFIVRKRMPGFIDIYQFSGAPAFFRLSRRKKKLGWAYAKSVGCSRQFEVSWFVLPVFIGISHSARTAEYVGTFYFLCFSISFSFVRWPVPIGNQPLFWTLRSDREFSFPLQIKNMELVRRYFSMRKIWSPLSNSVGAREILLQFAYKLRKQKFLRRTENQPKEKRTFGFMEIGKRKWKKVWTQTQTGIPWKAEPRRLACWTCRGTPHLCLKYA